MVLSDSLKHRFARTVLSGIIAWTPVHLRAQDGDPYPTRFDVRSQISALQPAPVVVRIGAVDQDLLALEIEAQRTQLSAVQPYEPQPGDETKVNRRDGIVKSVALIRGGKPIGYLAGKERRHVWYFETLIGNALDTAKADNPHSYQFSRAGTSETFIPQAVYRKSKPIDIALPAKEFPKRHTIYLKLPLRLRPGQTCSLRLPDLKLSQEEVTFTFDPSRIRSEAIHVSHIGFRPGDPVKQAFLSVWLGNGGAHTYDRKLKFRLLDHETGESVFEGVVGEPWPAGRPEPMKREQNHSRTDVAILDFSSFTKPGRYRICVESIGCSYPFDIDEGIWNEPFRKAMKGFYHQRSGIPLGPPYSTYTRPRPYHPDDGLVVTISDVTLMETRNGLNLLKESNNFDALNRHVTERVIENAWGGYFDAADWDRRVQHLEASRAHLELLELFPHHFRDLDLNIPESGNAIPDLLDEALFNIDFYGRLQTSAGGIRGGIEAAEHPVQGETSWLESLKVMAYAPGPWSSYIYANVAARAAFLLRPFDRDRATVLEQSAHRAWAWAESNGERYERQYGRQPQWVRVVNERNLAALEFYRLTHAAPWHDRFLEDTALTSSRPDRNQRHAAFLYARLPEGLGRGDLRENAKQQLLTDAATAIAFARKNAWGLASSNPTRAVGTGWFSTPDLIPLMRAHALTDDPDFYEAIVRGVSFSLGANPMNMTYTTGIGHMWPTHAMVLDTRRTARPVPEGITVFGQVDYALARDQKNAWHLGALDWYLVRKQTIFPDPFTWPVNESYWDIHHWPSACEFTPHSTMGDVAFMWGYFAAQSAR